MQRIIRVPAPTTAVCGSSTADCSFEALRRRQVRHTKGVAFQLVLPEAARRFGSFYLRQVLAESIDHYDRHRSHRTLAQAPPGRKSRA
jgi:hypothetical protein